MQWYPNYGPPAPAPVPAPVPAPLTSTPATPTTACVLRRFNLRGSASWDDVQVVSGYKTHASVPLSRFPPSSFQFLQYGHYVAFLQGDFHGWILWGKVIEDLIKFEVFGIDWFRL